MKVMHNTTVEHFINAAGWICRSPIEKANLEKAFDYFLHRVPLHVLNAPDHSSPWGPGRDQRTMLFSWLQGVSMASPVNPNRRLERNQRLKQFRFPSDRMNQQGNWFTWESTRFAKVALPAGQAAVRIFRVTRPLICLESTSSDAFAGWGKETDVPFADYRHGGGKQLFIYGDHAHLRGLEIVGGAK